MKRKYTFEESAVVNDLKYWGYYKGRQLAADGLPIEDTLYALIVHDEPGDHRVLVRDMPEKAWEINYRVMSLPSWHVQALVGRYCLPINEATWRPYTDSEIAVAMGCSARTFQRRVSEAKAAYRRAVFGPTLSELSA